jgi:hypothetical protein
LRLSIKSHLILILFFFPYILRGAELPEYGLSVKGLGMGNAFTGHAKGHDALFYNPAGFASLEGFQFRLMGLSVGLNGIDVYDEYADLFDNSDDLAATLNALYGRPIWTRLDYQLSMSMGPFIVGAYSRANAGFTLLNPALPNLDADYFAEYAFFGGVGFQLIPKMLDVGAVVKRITRVAGGGDITAATLAYLDSNLIEDMQQRTGVGYGVDFGAKLTLPGDWNPSVAFAWQDIGDTSFSFSETTPAPLTIKDRMNLALGLERELSGLVKIRPAIEYKTLNGSSTEVQIGKRIHAGLELELPSITLRGGFNQGYYTYGASFDFWLFQVDFATYGVELGEYVGQREDRRYVLQLTADFGIDGTSGNWFNFSKARKARRSGIKQRR